MLRRDVVLALALLACRDAEPVGSPPAITRYDDLYSVSVIDADHVVAVGDHGAAWWSEDGGESWRRGRTATDRPLYAVSMADRASGWAVGQQGVILHTRDGGRSWTLEADRNGDHRSHLFGVHALDARRAVAVGSWGARLATRDGGESWTDHSLRVTPDHPQFVWLSASERETLQRGGSVFEDVVLQDVSCLAGTDDCWLVGEFGSTFRSRDGGESWTRGEIASDTGSVSIAFPAGGTALGDDGLAALRAFAARIAGEEHRVVRLEPFAGAHEIAAYARGAGAVDLVERLAARAAEVQAALEAAGVASDRLRVDGLPPWDAAGAADPDPAAIARYLAQRRARDARVELSLRETPVLFAVDFADAETGLAVGLGGALLRTGDGGRSWIPVATGRRHALFAVAAGTRRAVAVGEQGTVLHSSDAGASWSAPDEHRLAPLSGFLRDLDFAPGADPRTGFSVGRGGAVLRTRDGGESWTQVLPPAG